MGDADTLVALLSELIAIDSVNPSLVPGGAGEGEIVAWIAAWAREAGLEVEVLEATPGRPSALVSARGSGAGSTLLLCGHVDTVGFEGMARPLEPHVEGDRMYGRGAYDMKGGLAAALVACRDAATLGLAGDVVVAAVADEEHASLGVQEVVGMTSADAAIVTEPTELELVVAHKGFVWSEIEITGRAAHGSRPHLGVDAIVKAGPVLTAIGELDEALGDREHALLGRPSVHASRIDGGTEMSSYPAGCVIGLEHRTLPGQSVGDVEAELAERLDSCRREDPALEVTARTLLVREPFEMDAGAELVRTLEDITGQVLGEPARVGGASFWADSAFIASAGIPTVLFGPVGDGAHAQEEWVSVSSCERVARTLASVATRICA
jgi:acetylornithine deacetylase